MTLTKIQSATDGLQGLVTFAQEQLSSAAENVTQLVGSLKTKLEPYAGLLTQIGLAVVNPSLIPVMLAGQAWVMLPDCYKGPLIDLLLDGVIGLVQASGSLPGFGGILGFLQGVRNQDTESKVKITNKLATILSGGSPDFIIGFVKGLGKGLWEGLTDPFKLAYEAVKGLGNLVSWLVSVANQAMSAPEEPALEPVAAGTTGTVPGGEVQTGSGGPPPELGQRMSEMASELQPPVEQVSQGFMPALQEAFSGGEGLTYEGLMQKLGEASAAVESAIQGAGEQLAQKVCEFLMQDSAEGSMGESVGWLAGTIAFEVVLGILTAGSWTAASGAMKVLKGFARILDWTGEALGMAFKALSKVGGYILDAIKGLGKLLSNAGGAIRGILDALQEIGEKLIRFGEELLGLSGRKAGREAAKEVFEETAEQTGKYGTDILPTSGSLNPPPSTSSLTPQDQSFLSSSTSKRGDQLTPDELTTELEVAGRSPRQQLNNGEYIEEIQLPNGHEWKQRTDGTWCRFSNQGDCMPGLEPGKADLDTIKAKYGFTDDSHTIGVSRTDIPGIDDTIEGLSPSLRKEVGLNSLDVVDPDRPIKSPFSNPAFTRHAEEDILNQYARKIDELGLDNAALDGKTVFIHISNPRGVCNKCMIGLVSESPKSGIIKQFSQRYPTSG